MSLTYGPSAGALDPPLPRAPQACMTCRKQKRKCDKALPTCSLCQRMNRGCDYSDAQPPPSPDDFNALKMRLAELENRYLQNGVAEGMTGPTSNASALMGSAITGPTPYTPSVSSSAMPGPDTAGMNQGPPGHAYLSPENQWQPIQNRFPAIAFLDADEAKYGQIDIPQPSVNIPHDILESLGDGAAVQEIINQYYETTHRWFPIISKQRMTWNRMNPLWEAGTDVVLLFLCMKLIVSQPQDGLDMTQVPAYISAKRFLAVMEAAGMVSIAVLQSGVLIALFEYGHAIYPAAWMSAGWCVRYGTMLGLNAFDSQEQLVGRITTWTEQEERRRLWWSVLIFDRLVSIGSKAKVLTSREPRNEDPLPADDLTWDIGEVGSPEVQKTVASPLIDHLSPFPRLCQASILMGKVLSHHAHEHIDREAKLSEAIELYTQISILTRTLSDTARESEDYLSFASPMALSYSAILSLCRGLTSVSNEIKTAEAAELANDIMSKALNCLRTVSYSTMEFAQHIELATTTAEGMDRISPLIMDSLYSAAASSAWLVRESGDNEHQLTLDTIRHCLRRLGSRWRNAEQYTRLLDAQEFFQAAPAGRVTA